MTRERARAFSFAARFLPRRVQSDVYTLYAFCRVVDDLVDDPPPSWSREQVRGQLVVWQRWLALSPLPPDGSALTAALADVLRRHEIPSRHLIDLIEGCKGDLDRPRFETFAQLERYCYQVGGTVGLTMCPILGVEHPKGVACARDLGIAMQLTNVIRDVAEDVAMGRHYLPAAELRAYGCRQATPESGGDLPGVIRFQCDRARSYYRGGLEGVRWIEPAARFAIQLAGTLYAAILDKVAQQRYDVYARRASTSLREKLWLAVRVRLGTGLTGP